MKIKFNGHSPTDREVEFTQNEIPMTDKELYNPDEFVLDNIKGYHYEVMDEGHHVWMAFYLENGSTGHLNIFLNDGKINTRYEEWHDEQSTETK